MNLTDHRDGARAEWTLPTDTTSAPLTLFWGDLHNHNAVGYAKGSLGRSVELAREHLDFFAFTGHASWHDMPHMPGERHLKWVRGFETHAAAWPRTQAMLREANDDDFVAFLGYEWHSSSFGDYCVIFPGGSGELFLPDHVERLLDFAAANDALAVPHHVAYRQGWRGANWEHFRGGVSPVVEVFSEHGCTMSERAPFPMLRHSNGGRWTANTIERQLARGLRFGYVASSDDHLGYPGAYGEGVVGVWAEELSKPALLEAIRSRRTIAATGDRIAVEMTLNGQPMGGEAAFCDERQIDVRVTAQDAIASIELIRNGRVIARYFPEDHRKGVRPHLAHLEPPEAYDEAAKWGLPPFLPAEKDSRPLWPGRAKCRIQYGWGPWADLGLGRICDWDMTVQIDGGRFLRALPCFQSAPFDEDRRDRLRFISENRLLLQSATSRVGAFAEDPTKSLIVELEGGPDAVLSVQLQAPAEMTVSSRLADLLEDNIVEFTGPFTSESFVIGRLISPSEYSAEVRWHDRREGARSQESGVRSQGSGESGQTLNSQLSTLNSETTHHSPLTTHQTHPSSCDWYYVRVTQHNSHVAWSSPVFVRD